VVFPHQVQKYQNDCKRIVKELKDANSDPELLVVTPNPDNMLRWHFTFEGSPNSPYANGIYHGEYLLPKDYPYKPPDFIMLTKNGRFVENQKICMSISSFHAESWSPIWNARTALLGLKSFMTDNETGHVGSAYTSDDMKKAHAIKSNQYHCPKCGDIRKKFNELKKPAIVIDEIEEGGSKEDPIVID